MTYTVSIAIPNFGSYFRSLRWRQYLDLARMIDDAGIGRIVVADHVVMGKAPDYPWGDFLIAPESPYLEPITTLAAFAAVTSHVRLATGILIAPLRPAAVLAKTAATLDVLSEGRVDLGIGVGWQREEYEACGIPFDERWRRLSDTMRACRALWTGELTNFVSDTVEFDEIYCSPAPVQEGGIPIWLGGGTTPPNLRRLAEWSDGWIPIPINFQGPESIIATVAEGRPLIREAWQKAGRDPDLLQIRPPLPLLRTATTGPHDLGRSLGTLPALLEAGATDVSIPVHAFCRDLDAVPAFLADLVRRSEDVAGPATHPPLYGSGEVVRSDR